MNTTVFSLRISEELKQRVTETAKATGTNRNAWITEAIIDKLGPAPERPGSLLDAGGGGDDPGRFQVAPEPSAVAPSAEKPDWISLVGKHRRDVNRDPRFRTDAARAQEAKRRALEELAELTR